MSPEVAPVEIRHLIGGEWIGDGGHLHRNPADETDVVAVLPSAEAGLVDAAVDAAADAAAAWRDTPAPARGAMLATAADLVEQRAAQIARDLCREEGKTLAEASGEVRRTSGLLRFFAAEGWRLRGETLPASTSTTRLFTVREPLGVVAIITPWNFPIAIPAWKLAPALVAGNTVVVKPAGATAVSLHHLAHALVDAGLPAGVLNVLNGSGSVIGDALVRDTRVAAVSFTGSTAVGRRINEMVAPRFARAQLEMGGKNALVVLDDADAGAAAAIAAQGGFGLTGQACTATSRVLCTPRIHDAFLEALASEARAYVPGNGLQAGTRMGPVVSDAQLRSALGHLRGARADGVEVVSGGDHDGLFLEATVLAGVDPSMAIARDEVFAPVISVLAVDDLDHAIAVANASAYGLAAGIATSDLAAAFRFADEADVGVVKVNSPTTGLELNMPFGGVKDSSSNTFREQGTVATEFYTRLKSVYITI